MEIVVVLVVALFYVDRLAKIKRNFAIQQLLDQIFNRLLATSVIVSCSPRINTEQLHTKIALYEFKKRRTAGNVVLLASS